MFNVHQKKTKKPNEDSRAVIKLLLREIVTVLNGLVSVRVLVHGKQTRGRV